MKIGKYSESRIFHDAAQWQVPKSYAAVIYNYLVCGYDPGSFFTSVLANDFFGAMGHGHPGNDFLALKNLAAWIYNLKGENVFWGSYSIVKKWTKLSAESRREKLEELGIIFTEHEEIVLILKDEPCPEPFFYT